MAAAQAPDEILKRLERAEAGITDLQARLAFLDDAFHQQNAVLIEFTKRVVELERLMGRIWSQLPGAAEDA